MPRMNRHRLAARRRLHADVARIVRGFERGSVPRALALGALEVLRGRAEALDLTMPRLPWEPIDPESEQ